MRPGYAEQPWPEAVMPTAEEWRAWFLACSPEAQYEIAERALEMSATSSRCFLENHDSLRDEVAYLRQRARRLHLAWVSARRWRRAFRMWLASDINEGSDR